MEPREGRRDLQGPEAAVGGGSVRPAWPRRVVPGDLQLGVRRKCLMVGKGPEGARQALAGSRWCPTAGDLCAPAEAFPPNCPGPPCSRLPSPHSQYSRGLEPAWRSSDCFSEGPAWKACLHSYRKPFPGVVAAPRLPLPHPSFPYQQNGEGALCWPQALALESGSILANRPPFLL